MPSERMIEFLRLISDRSRLKILRLLKEGEICVCEMAAILGIAQPTVSQHLAKLRALGLVKERREGQWVIYSLQQEVFQSCLDELVNYFSTPLDKIPELREEAARFLATRQQGRESTCRLPDKV